MNAILLSALGCTNAGGNPLKIPFEGRGRLIRASFLVLFCGTPKAS